ncbi:metallophosphoesterase [uncultured Friedmanniella sp.]|uniref:metallophosphoesterase n=1 Tax=uncultured Friedmanniella sp. TaxID=335381 RepID=UPI0035CB26EE
MQRESWQPVLSTPESPLAPPRTAAATVRRDRRRPLVTLLAASLAVPGLVLLAPSGTAVAAAAASCGSFDRTVRERVNPSTQTSSLTTSATQSAATAGLGFTSVRDTSVLAAQAAGRGLVAVHRLYRPARGDFFYTSSPADIARVVSAMGYVDQGTAFYAGRAGRSCLVAVTSYRKGQLHRFVTSRADKAALVATGWKKQKVRFYLRKAPVDTKFTVAVMPDTQQEVLSNGDGRMLNRANYLVKNRSALDLRYVSHTGDVVNWDTADHAQYQRAAAGLKPITAAGIPLSLTIGNHDTEATCPGGSACDAARTRVLFRTTGTFNSYLKPGPLDQEGAFQRGKIDNTFHVFSAGGGDWLVLNLELWPRKSVVAWAQQVVATHPRHNVMVLTHSYLTSSGKIYQGRGGYGDTSGQYLYDHLISRYANIRVVFSGHTGTSKHRVDHGVHGNRIDSYLLAMHSTTTNPMRFVEIDTRADTLRTWVYAPWTKHTYTGASYRSTSTKMGWILG